MKNPLVSVIIPTKNSEKYLDICISSIKNQTYKNIEIIVVDNNSTDRTKEIARKYTEKVYNKGPERSPQKNYGVKKAKGELIYFVDSDFVLEDTVVEEAVKKINQGFDSVVVHNTSDPTISFWSKVRKFERDMYKYNKSNIAVRFLKKEAFNKINGFDETLIACEDYDFHNRIKELGYKFAYVDVEEKHLGEPKSIIDIAKKHYYYGKKISKFINKKNNSVWQLCPLREAYFKNWKKFIRHPMLAAGFIVYQFVRYGSAVCGYLFGKR